MTQTTTSYLNSLLSFYTPLSTAFDAARTHRSGIETRLDVHLGVREMFETGSLKHGTGVYLYSDADYIVSLKGTRPTPSTALNSVRESLKDRYPTTSVHVSRPAVVCDFAGGDETVEVVPAFKDNTDGGYWIPDPKDPADWMKSHPKDHNAYVNLANAAHSGAAKKLTRLAKTWKYKRSVPMSSCYLEMRAAKYAKDVSNWILPMDLHYFLKSLQTIQLSSMNDPTNLGSRFTPCSSASNRTEALSKLDTAVSRSQKACDHYVAGNDAGAITQWKLVFNQ